jgi:hypothetical protein
MTDIKSSKHKRVEAFSTESDASIDSESSSDSEELNQASLRPVATTEPGTADATRRGRKSSIFETLRASSPVATLMEGIRSVPALVVCHNARRPISWRALPFPHCYYYYPIDLYANQ